MRSIVLWVVLVVEEDLARSMEGKGEGEGLGRGPDGVLSDGE